MSFFEFVDFNRDEAHKRIGDSLRAENVNMEMGRKILDKPTGDNVQKRWLVTNKEFKPLRDLLKISRDPICQSFHKHHFENDTSIQQFVMSPEVAFEVQRLAKNLFFDRPQDLIKLMPKVMTPYPKVCVEMPLTDEVRTLRGPVVGEFSAPVRRIGAYIQTFANKNNPDELVFTFSPYHEFDSGFVSSSYVLLVHAKNEMIPGFLAIRFAEFENMIWNATLEPSMLSIAKKNNVSPKDLYKAFCEDTDAFKLMASEAAEDLPTLFVAWLVLLNSKSGLTKTAVRPRIANTMLGKRERARRGRSGYTIVSLSDTEDVDGEGIVTKRPMVQAHRVRGHFKAKKWGVYWWRPHVRGVGELKEREGYTLTT